MSDNETLRDTFAAAAMTGIIAASDDSEIKQPQAEFLARQAWLVADAMLRERAATNHDAAPAAKATSAEAVMPHTDSASDRSGNPTSHGGTGDTTREPAAWLLDSSRQDAPIGLFWTQDEAAVLAGGNTGRVFPLYRVPPPPALTDAEREALEWAACEADEYEEDEPIPHQRAATLRALIARLGGGK